MPTTKKATPEAVPPSEPGALYSARDFRAATDAVEKDTDSAWNLWLEANRPAEELKADPRYSRTVPQDLNTQPAGLGEDPGSEADARKRARAHTVEDAMVEARSNNRVCPRPSHWQQLYDMLPDKKKNKPQPPLVGPAWNTTPSIDKRTCLREHFEWAYEKGMLDEVVAFMRKLPESEWFHMDD